MEKITETLFCMLGDRNIDIMCKDFSNPVTVVNPSLLVIQIEDQKVGINSVKFIATTMESYNINHCIVLYLNNITVFAKNEIKKLITEENKTIELFLFSELMYNITKHMLVPKHILLTQSDKRTLMKKYHVTEKQIPKILSSDPVSRYFNAKPGQIFQIIRDSNITYKSVSYRIVV